MKGIRLLLVTGVLAALVVVPLPAQAQLGGTALTIVYSGTATVNGNLGKGIFFPGLDNTGQSSWVYDFRSSNACAGAGVSGGTPAAGGCNLASAGDLFGDLFPFPHCGNSRGQSFSASVTDPLGRQWSGEVHWDGVLGGDPSYSLGSQLVLFGTMGSDAGTAQVVLVLNATGGSQCAEQTSGGNGAKEFIVNGIGTLTV